MYSGSITDIPGLIVGHAQDTRGLTGVTVVLARDGAVAGVDVRGSAPGTRETSLMQQGKAVERVQGIVLAGGSAYGLAAADGVMIFCEQNGIGLQTPGGVVPIIPAAVIYDLEYGSSDVRPNAGMGYAACVNASQHVQQGSIGAGIGATVGKVLGMKYCQKGGIGTASIQLGDSRVIVGAIVCVNAYGDVWEDGRIIAGACKRGEFVDASEYLIRKKAPGTPQFRNTTIGVVATNASLDRSLTTKIAQIAQDGLARSISPVHTMVDGDTIFGLSYGAERADTNRLLAATAESVRRAVVNAVLSVGAF